MNLSRSMSLGLGSRGVRFGPNLAATDAALWTPNVNAAFTNVGSDFLLARIGVADCRAGVAIATTSGRTYRVTGRLVENAALRACQLVLGTGITFSSMASQSLSTASGVYSFDYTATGTPLFVFVTGALINAPDTARFSEIRVREIL